MPANICAHKIRFAGMARSYAQLKSPWGMKAAKPQSKTLTLAKTSRKIIGGAHQRIHNSGLGT